MASERVQQFIDALKQLEQSGEPDFICSLFSDECEIGNVVAPHRFHGPEGARQFWRDYRGLFEELASTFRTVIEAGDRVALEWETEALGHDGQPVHYEGVSLLEFDEGDRIARFHAFFDSGLLGRQLAGGRPRHEAPGIAMEAPPY